MFLTNKEKSMWSISWLLLLSASALFMVLLFDVHDPSLFVLTFLIETAFLLVVGGLYFAADSRQSERFNAMLWRPPVHSFCISTFSVDDDALSKLLAAYYSQFIFDDLGNEEGFAQEDLNRGKITIVNEGGEQFQPNVRRSQGEGVGNLFNRAGFIDPKFQVFLQKHAYQKLQGYAVMIGTIFSGSNEELSIEYEENNIPFQQTDKASQYTFTQTYCKKNEGAKPIPILQVKLENEYRDTTSEYFKHPLNFILSFDVELKSPGEEWGEENPALIKNMQFTIQNGNQLVPNKFRTNHSGSPETYDTVIRRYLMSECQRDYDRKAPNIKHVFQPK